MEETYDIHRDDMTIYRVVLTIGETGQQNIPNTEQTTVFRRQTPQSSDFN